MRRDAAIARGYNYGYKQKHPLQIRLRCPKPERKEGEEEGRDLVFPNGVGTVQSADNLVKRVVRTNYSNPPTHGGQVVATIFGNPQLRALWEREVGEMRERIKTMRKALVDGIHKRVPGSDFSFVLKQRGMFSYSGLTKEQVRRLREENSIYTIDTGRICVAALTMKNVDYVADAIAKVIR